MSGPRHKAGVTEERKEAGFTLVEMLIVLVIIGVSASVVALSVGSLTRAPSVESEARGLATRLQAAADDAMLGDRTIAMTVDAHGYGFAVMKGRELVPLEDKGLAFHTLPAGMVMTLDARPPVILGVDGSGQPMSAMVESGRQKWIVTYDGMTATAAEAPKT
jgi:general secretion pathway protein H